MLKLLLLLLTKQEPSIFNSIFSVILILGGILIIGRGLFKFIEGFYVDFIRRKPLFRHFYPFAKDLNKNQKSILKNQYAFYKKLDLKQQKYFRYRVAKFISRTEFIGKEGLIIDDEKKTLVAATAYDKYSA